MNALSDGIEIDPAVHTQVLTNKLMESRMREVQMEAAIQTLILQKRVLEGKLKAIEDEVFEEEADASAK